MILIGANQDTVFKRLCEAMQRDELAVDERYNTHTARGNRQTELDELIADWTKRFNTKELLDLLEQYGVPAGKIFTVPDMLADPHYQARETLVEVDHPDYQNLKMQNVFPRLSVTPGKVKWTGPAIGQHNDEIFQGMLGLSDERIRELQQEKVI